MRIIRTLLLSVALLVAGQWLIAEDAVLGHVSLDGLYYNLNTEEQTAVVTLVMYPFLPAIRNGSSTAGYSLRRMAARIPLPV